MLNEIAEATGLHPQAIRRAAKRLAEDLDIELPDGRKNSGAKRN